MDSSRFQLNPSYQKIVIHKIQVFRDGQWADRMHTSTHKLLQQEKRIRFHNLYNGDLSLVYFLDDIRVGDIVEYACSYIGKNPLFCSHYTRILSLQSQEELRKISHRILGTPFTPFVDQAFLYYFRGSVIRSNTLSSRMGVGRCFHTTLPR